MNLIAHTDGGSRGNPGPAAIGVVIRCGDKVVQTISEFEGTTTNNVAEYSALMHALKYARLMDAESLTVYADSEVVVKQIRGEYQVASEQLKPLHDRAKQMIELLPAFNIYHVRREFNSEADALVNQVLDRIQGKK